MKVINLLNEVYKESPEGTHGDRVRRAIQDYNYPNVMPLNILKAVYLYNAVAELKQFGQTTDEELRCLLNRLVIRTGYTRKEIQERIDIK